MAVGYARFVRHVLAPGEAQELVVVDQTAQTLQQFLEQKAEQIDRAHVFGAQSAVIQAIIGGLLGQAGFASEVVITPEDGFVTRARPDFFLRLGPGRGILAEVERGGAVNNNHDLKDVWKAHIAPDAQHLFLVVPNSNFTADGSAREKPFVRVKNRSSSFFGDRRREVDILSLHVFGYGRAR
jgi:hypothetical protein